MYDHTKIENSWKTKWFADNIYEAVDFDKRPKRYVLAELPYPSGKFLHAGHMMRYTVPEIYSRFLRMRGFNVMFPMGWDAFGLPAETFAIKNGITPREAIDNAKLEYKNSMQDMGYGIDWAREFTTSEPEYYKWTQWIFLKLWEKGLVEVQEMPAWWCQELGVLADEEVIPDPDNPGQKISERGGYKVERKQTKQWVLKITAYADKLIEGLGDVNYPDSIKNAQRNWIGRKEGITIEYPVVDTPDTLKCFTTRPETNYGATFIALSPEHEFTQKLVSQNLQIAEYVSKAAQKSDLERMENKDKSGVFTGFYALNRLTDKKMPIWVSDYVLDHYGTGALVGVPAHDKRDFEFASKFELAIIQVVQPLNEPFVNFYEGDGTCINSGILNGMPTAEAAEKVSTHLEKKRWGSKSVTYKLRDQIWSRQRYWGDPIPLIHTQSGRIEPNTNLPVILPDITKEQAEKAKELNEFPPLNEFLGWSDTIDSDGNKAQKEVDTMPTWAGSNWYYLRYIDPNNQAAFANAEKLKYWLPVDKYFGGSEHTTVHLLYSRFWHRFLYDNELVPTKEPYAARLNGGLLLGPDSRKMSKRWGNVIDPKDLIQNYGADATRTYIAFIGPYTETFPWDNNGIKACYRFLKNIHTLSSKISDAPDDLPVLKAFHKMVKNVTEMLTDLKMNTGVSELMIFVNVLKRAQHINKDTFLGFLKVLAPFAPFLAEDLWQSLNGFASWQKEQSIHLQSWPEFDSQYILEEYLTIPVQINGKLREQVRVISGASEAEIKEAVFGLEKVKSAINGKELKNYIYVPGKIVNIVI